MPIKVVVVLLSEAYPVPSELSKIQHFAKINNGFQPLTIFVKPSVLDVSQGSIYASGYFWY